MMQAAAPPRTDDEKKKVIFLSIGIVLVLGFCALQIGAVGAPAKSNSTGQVVSIGQSSSGSSSAATTAAPAASGAANSPAPAGQTASTIPSDSTKIIEVPAYVPPTTSPFHSELTKASDGHQPPAIKGSSFSSGNSSTQPMSVEVGPGQELSGPVGTSISPDSAKASLSKFTVRGIMTGGGEPIAIIADGETSKMVRRGMCLSDGSRVVAIHEHEVRLRHGRAKTVLKYPS